MKIAFVVQSFPTVSETFIVNQISDLIDRGHEIKIFSFSEIKNTVVHQKIVKYGLLNKTSYLNEKIISKRRRLFHFLNFLISNQKNVNKKKLAGMFNLSKHGTKYYNLRFFNKIRCILHEGHFDIIHAHFGPSGAYMAEMKSLGFYSHARLVTSFHGYDLSPHKLSSYEKIYFNLFQEADLLTVNTEYTKSLLQRVTNKKNIEVLPVGLNTAEFKKKSSEASAPFQILFVGRLIPLKGPDLTVEITKELINRGFEAIKLTIVGDGELYPTLEEEIIKTNLHEFVELKGALTQQEIIDVMETADVFLLPGIYDSNGRAETQGLVIQEAQAMELPVLVSDVGGMKYGMLPGETGFVVTEKNIAAFADKIEILIKDVKLRKQMGRNGRAFVVEHYDSKVLGDKLLNLYNTILTSSK